MRLFLFPLLSINFILIFIIACQVKEQTVFEKAKNPYAHLGVEGYIGSAMTMCLGIPDYGPPIIREKKGAIVINKTDGPERSSYFDCVDNQIQTAEKNILADEPD